MRGSSYRFRRASVPGSRAISWIILCSIFSTVPAFAVERTIEKVFPSPACAEGWVMQEKATLFDKETLFDRIDGEAELYFPYGFELLAYVRYQSSRNPKIAVDADVYRMGSLLDAFGIYANYRRKKDAVVTIGAEGTVSSSQLLFYQERYFVRLQATGTTSLGQDIFLACARAISQNLPRNAARPKELEAFVIPGVVPKSERYIARSLLGYDFFRRGLIADAILNGEQMQVFLVPEDSRDAAAKVFDRYRSYLQTSGKDIQVTGMPDRNSLEAFDPLYGNVYVEQEGRFLIGAIRAKSASAEKQLVGRLRRHVGGSSPRPQEIP
jgi:hypothetical protein